MITSHWFRAAQLEAGRATECHDQAQRPEQHWGTWCPHGVQIVEKDPNLTDPDGYPVGRIVDPWPCGQCALEDFERDMAAEEDAYWESMWSEVYR